jgi:hypothetical protein
MSIYGRPPKYETPEELEAIVEKYFAGLMDDKGERFIRPPTVSGLAYALGMSTRSLLRYEGRDDFCPIVTRAKQVCELFLEETAIIGKSKNPISLLGMNFNRVERKEVDHGVTDDLADILVSARKRVKRDGDKDTTTTKD